MTQPVRIKIDDPRRQILQKNKAKHSLMEICRKAIFENRLVFVAVTSSAEGYVQSEGLPYGQGKSQFAMGLSRILHEEACKVGYSEAEGFVKGSIGYTEKAVLDMVERGREKRVPVWISDDMEVAFGKHRSFDNQCREIAYFMQTVRPYLGVFIGTMPDLGQIARCWRDLFMFEVKIPFRGYAEVQQIKRWSDFYDPLDPKLSLAYGGEQEYPKVSLDMEAWYTVWRDEQVKVEQDRIRNKYYKKPEKPEDVEVPKPPSDDYHSALGKRSGVKRRENRERLQDLEEKQRLGLV
jgi:hypothetical protein